MLNQSVDLVIFDLDGTLLDFQGAENLAKYKISQLLANMGVNNSIYWEIFTEVNNELFRNMVDGELSIESYRITRFVRTMELAMGKKVVGTKELKQMGGYFNDIYMQSVNDDIEMFNDVLNVLKQLEKRCAKLAILTNGPADGQRKKIKKFGLQQCCDVIHISGETGFSKPNSDAFYNLTRACNVNESRALMIGDSLADDIYAANKLGIRSILIDRENENNTYSGDKVSSLNQIDLSQIE